MKIVITKACPEKNWEVGTRVEATPEQFNLLEAEEMAVRASDWDKDQAVIKANERIKAAAETAVDNAIADARKRGALAPKEDASPVKATAVDLELNKPGLGVAYIGNMPVKHAPEADLERRITASNETSGIEVDEDKNVRAVMKGVIMANEPFLKQSRNGGLVRACGSDEFRLKEVVNLSRARSVQTQKLANMITAGADFVLNPDTIKAAGVATDESYFDPNSLVGVLNTGLVLQWNLGFLKNQLVMLNDITTDISNQPVLFNQQVRTRYVKVPAVQLKAYNTGWKSNQGKGTVDVNVRMDTHAGVPIAFNETVLGSTARQLFNEQKTPQLYALGEYAIYKLVDCICNGSARLSNTDGTSSTVTFAPGYTGTLGAYKFDVSNGTLATFVADLPEAMDEAKFPGGDEQPGDNNLMRFAWVHGRVYALAAANDSFILNQSIQSIRNQSNNGNVMETGRFERLGNIKFRKSQLMTDQCTVASETITGMDLGSTNTATGYTVSAGTFASASTVGFAGTRSSLLFVSRIPTDWTKIMPEIPSTAAVEIVTEPETGLSFLVVKYLDHNWEAAFMRVEFMFGVGIGDERQGLPLCVK